MIYCYFIVKSIETTVLCIFNNLLLLFNKKKSQKITAKQLTNHYNFHVLTTNHIYTKLTNPNHNQRHKYNHLRTTLHLTLKMTTTQVVDTSVTNNSLKDNLHLDNHTYHTRQITDIFMFTQEQKNSS